MLIFKTKKTIYLRPILLFGVFSAVFFSSCTLLTSETDSKKPEELPPLEHVVGIGKIEPVARILSLHSRTNGLVGRIYHDINSAVKKDSIILALDDRMQALALAQIQSTLITQKSLIQESKKQIELMEIRLENTNKTYERDEALILHNVISQQEFDNTESGYKEAIEQVKIAKDMLQTQIRKSNEIQKSIDYQAELLEQTRIRAPLNGKILSMDLKIGESVKTDQAIGEFAPEGPWMVLTEIDEQFADKIKEGMRAYIRPQGQKDTLSMGEVFLASPSLHKKTLFSDSSSNMEDRRVREVRVLLEDHTKVLIGQKVECVILLTEP